MDESKEIQLLRDSPVAIIRPPKEDIDKRIYFKDEIEKLKNEIEILKRELRRFEYIEKFLILYCPKTTHNIDIIKCSNDIKNHLCKPCLNRQLAIQKII